MRHIQKSAPPGKLVAYRNDEQASFDDFPDKGLLRDALVREQGYLCCYCLRRIEPDEASMRIEHWAPQDLEPKRRFDWTNLLGACRGGEGGDARRHTCDVRKRATPIAVDPTKRDHVARVRFRGDGTVHSDDAAIQASLDGTLNLNDAPLVAARKTRVRRVLEELARRHQGSWSRALLERLRDEWRPAQVTGRLPELCEVVAQELDRKLARTA